MQASDGFGLLARRGHFHQFDAVTFGVFNPCLPVAVTAGNHGAGERHAAHCEGVYYAIEVVHGEAKVIEANRFTRCGAVPSPLGKNSRYCVSVTRT